MLLSMNYGVRAYEMVIYTTSSLPCPLRIAGITISCRWAAIRLGKIGINGRRCRIKRKRMALKEYVVLKPELATPKRKRWFALFMVVMSTFFNTIMPFIIGVYFAQSKSILLLIFLLFPLLFDVRRRHNER